MITERKHLGRQEEAVNETGVQIRATDPSAPVPEQLWINTSQNRVKYFDGLSTVVLVAGHIGAALEVPPSGILDAAVSRSYYKNVTANYAITSFDNFPDGVTVFLKVQNTNPEVKEVTNIVFPSPTMIANGSYFLLNSANNTNKYYVWADFDGFGVNPAVGGRTGIKVLTSAGLKETTTLTFGAASSMSSGQYFLINTANNVNQYYVWFNKDTLGGEPQGLTGKTGIQIVISSADDALAVASKVKDALNLASGLTATFSGNIVTVVNTSVGTCTDASNPNTSGLTIAITQQGKVADTATEFAQKAATAIGAIAANFIVPAPVSPTITVTNTNFGFTNDAQDGNMGASLTITVTTQGSGRIEVTFPANASVDEVTNGFVNGAKERIFRLFRSSNLVYVAPNGTYTLP